MKNNFFYFAFVLFFYGSLNAQIFEGKLIDNTGEPVPYVNIGVLSKNIGTVSDINGNFKLNLATVLAQDTIRFSSIGYETIDMLVKNKSVPVMKEKSVQLQTVEIKPKKPIYYKAGNKYDSKSVTAGFTTNDLGSEVGTLIKVRKKPSWLHKIHFNMAQNKLGKIKFRVNIYQMNGNDVGKNILTEPLYIETELVSGSLTLDLKDKYILLQDDCMISLEWIADYGENKGNLVFSAGMLGAKLFFRKTSQASWETVAGIGVGFYAELMHEKD